MRYAWRVQAIAKEGIEDTNVFKNEGYSQIFWFDYKGNCPVVTTSGVITKGMEASVSWQPTQASTTHWSTANKVHPNGTSNVQ